MTNLFYAQCIFNIYTKCFVSGFVFGMALRKWHDARNDRHDASDDHDSDK